MTTLRWARDQFYNPSVMTKFHTASLVVWTLFVPVTLLTDLKDSIPWLAFLSVWALATGAWAALQAAHGEQEQDRMLTELTNEIDGLRADVRALCSRLDSEALTLPSEGDRSERGHGTTCRE